MPRRSLAIVAAMMAATTLTIATPGASASVDEPTLVGRALLSPDASAPAPFAGTPDTDPTPAPGARQPVGGFSALLKAPGKDTFWAMPDNGFGSKANSRSFLLRVYRVHADFKTARGGSGEVEVLDSITLRDPRRKVPFPIVTEGTRKRLLTGGDFDIESMRVARDGSLWFGEEFGPFLLHADATGKLLEAPIALPGVRSPDSPTPGAANLGSSSGFEAMAISPDRRTLYPILEGPVAGDDPTRRRVYAFDIASGRYVDRLPDYRVADPAFKVADATALDGRRLVVLERDNEQGEAAEHKQGFVADLRRTASDGTLAKRPVVDLLDLRDPAHISLPGRPGDIGLGDPFSMPYVTIESVLPLGGDRLAIVNDTNFGSTGRNPELPDPSDFIVVRVPGLRGGGGSPGDGGGKRPLTLSVIGDTPYSADQIAAFPRLVDDINGDPKVRLVMHLGDVKNGSSPCTDERLRLSRDLYETFEDPFVLTPGDNEWTDCHRPAAGGFLPTERLAAVRDIFYPQPGRTLGRHPIRVHTQADQPAFKEYVENTMWTRSQVVFSTVHVVGSANDLEPWFGEAETAEQRRLRLAEYDRRLAADLGWLRRTFATARQQGARGVVVGMQADTFSSSRKGFEPIIALIERLAADFDGPVLLLQGDTHKYKVDRPLPGAPNVTRIVVEGETADEWLRLRVDPRAQELFSWQRERLDPAGPAAANGG